MTKTPKAAPTDNSSSGSSKPPRAPRTASRPRSRKAASVPPQEASMPTAQESALQGTPAPAPSEAPVTQWQMIAEAAYYRAERRGFAPGGELDDWLEAEQQLLDDETR